MKTYLLINVQSTFKVCSDDIVLVFNGIKIQ